MCVCVRDVFAIYKIIIFHPADNDNTGVKRFERSNGHTADFPSPGTRLVGPNV